ncbi:malate synthase A, partial [Nonomuraea sp. NPDC004297]
AAELLSVSETPGEITEAGLRNNVDVALRYLAAWMGGLGAVAIHNLMEDAATAEISRSQIWQWIHNDITLADTAQQVTKELVERIISEELARIAMEPGYDEKLFAQATALFKEVALDDDFADFLTLPAYARMP